MHTKMNGKIPLIADIFRPSPTFENRISQGPFHSFAPHLVYLPLLLTLLTPLPAVELSDVLTWDREQHQDKAMESFLQWIDEQAQTENTEPTEEEKKLFEELRAYSTNPPHGMSEEEVARELLTRCSSLLETHPNYTLINYLLATAYFVLGDGQHFYPTFAASYKDLPDHYYAHKLQGMLCQRLMQASIPGPTRDRWARQALRLFQATLERYPEDTQLYTQVLLLSPQEDAQGVAQWCLKQLMTHDYPVPRRYLEFWVNTALTHDSPQVARAFINHAKKWYSFSRQLEAAEKKINAYEETSI